MFRRLKAGSIEPHPSEKAIILNYKLEATVFGDPGDPMLEESKVSVIIDFSNISAFSTPLVRLSELPQRHRSAVNLQKILMCKFCSQNCQRIIRLKSLSSKTDPAVLAKEVVEKCDIIHKSQISEVEQIIYYLKNRKDTAATTGML